MAVEEQTQHNTTQPIDISMFHSIGQRLTVSNRKITKLGFWIGRNGSIAGQVYFKVVRVSDDGVIQSQLWGNINDLGAIAYKEVTFVAPDFINEEVRIIVEPTAGDSGDHVLVGCQDTDVKADESYTRYRHNTSEYEEIASYDCAYRYTYELPSGETAYNTMVGSPTSWMWEKCDYGAAEKCPVGSEPSWAWQAPTSEGPNKTPQGGPTSFIWATE